MDNNAFELLNFVSRWSMVVLLDMALFLFSGMVVLKYPNLMSTLIFILMLVVLAFSCFFGYFKIKDIKKENH